MYPIVRCRLDYIVRDDHNLVVEIEQAVDCGKNDARSANAALSLASHCKKLTSTTVSIL